MCSQLFPERSHFSRILLAKEISLSVQILIFKDFDYFFFLKAILHIWHRVLSNFKLSIYFIERRPWYFFLENFNIENSVPLLLKKKLWTMVWLLRSNKNVFCLSPYIARNICNCNMGIIGKVWSPEWWIWFQYRCCMKGFGRGKTKMVVE